MKKHHSPQSTWDELLIHLPFSLYHGWTTVLVVLSLFEAFSPDASAFPASALTKAFVFLALFFLEATAAAYAFSSAEGDLPASVAIAWSLWAVFAHQTDSRFVHWSALGFAVLALVWVVKGAAGVASRSRGGRLALANEDQEPLIN